MTPKATATGLTIAIISSLATTLVNFRGPLITEMIQRGHRVLAYAPDHDAQTRAALIHLGAEPVDYRMSRTGLNPMHDVRAVFDLTRLLRRHKPDLVFSYFIKPVIYGTIAARLAGVPRRFAMIEGMGFVFTTADKPSPARKFLQFTATKLFQLSLSFAQRLILLNPDDHRECLERRLIAPERTAVLGGIGVDLNEWPYHQPLQNPVVFVFVGRLLRDKGVQEFADAAAILHGKGHSARFVMLGGHDVNPTAIDLATVMRWVSDGTIEWPGHVPVGPALRTASVFVLPSYREGVPRSTQEAMATGLPVITTDVPGCRETVIPGKNGFLVPAKDAIALAEAMEFFINHPDQIVQQGQASRRLAEERFDVHLQNDRLLTMIGL